MKISFDPWGNRMSYTAWNTKQTQIWFSFDRGFTGHEHLMRYGLVNMNGRVYDPVTSTFLSVDNFVQDPSSTQNFNRYAYCLNNPLKYTDPDGEWAHLLIGALIGGIVNLATNWSSINTFGEGLAYFGIGATAGITGAATGGAAAGTMKLGGFVSGAVSGAAGGASSGFITGSGNRGFVDYRKGFNFWDGSKVDEFIDGTLSTGWDDYSDSYNSSQKAYHDTEYLKQRINEDFGVNEGDYNINKITTRSSSGYKITQTGKYINPKTNSVIGGYCRSFSSGYSELHISPFTTNSDAITFKAVVGHELIHAYHHYSIPSINYNKVYSERVAYRYTHDVYLHNAHFSDALKVMYEAKSLDYWGYSPMNYHYHPF